MLPTGSMLCSDWLEPTAWNQADQSRASYWEKAALWLADHLGAANGPITVLPSYYEHAALWLAEIKRDSVSKVCSFFLIFIYVLRVNLSVTGPLNACCYWRKIDLHQSIFPPFWSHLHSKTGCGTLLLRSHGVIHPTIAPDSSTLTASNSKQGTTLPNRIPHPSLFKNDYTLTCLYICHFSP